MTRAFRQRDVERALRAAKREGYAHPTVEICTDGTLRLLTAETGPTPVLPLDRWLAGKRDGHRAA